jgi:hypothetical protein
MVSKYSVVQLLKLLMGQRIIYVVMFVLASWVICVSFRIEVLNARAGFYLPRRDQGTWRVSRQDTPRDQLRRLIEREGLLQYLFAPILIGLGLFWLLRRGSAQRRALALGCIFIGLVALTFAFVRGYLSSLGD